MWISLIYSLSRASDEREHGLRLVYGAVGAVIGLQLIALTFSLFSPSEALTDTRTILRITVAAGSLVLVHNLYGQAAPESRSHIRLAMLGPRPDVGLRFQFLHADLPPRSDCREPALAGVACRYAERSAAPPLGARNEQGWRIRLSRAAIFQSISLLAICAHFALMAILGTALAGLGLWYVFGADDRGHGRSHRCALVLMPSARARGRLKVKLAKHVFDTLRLSRDRWLHTRWSDRSRSPPSRTDR